MNTGLHDIWNLVWKLDLSLHGHGNERLLDNYSAERLPVSKQVIEAWIMASATSAASGRGPNTAAPEDSLVLTESY